MTEQRERELIRRAIDQRFSDKQGDPLLAERIIQMEKRETKVKKKMSVGLVLALVLLLVALTGLAAVMMSMRQVVEEKAIPIANEYEGESYTAEDTNILLQLAEENGITLSQNAKKQIQDALDKGEGYFKEEMLMAFSKAEFGENLSDWTLEQQKWFNDALAAIGFIDNNSKVIPEGGENAKLSIIEAAKKYIYRTSDANAPLDDTAKYHIGAQYINGDIDGDYPGLYWSIDFIPQYLDGAVYWIYIRDDDEVLGDFIIQGLNESSTVNEVYDAYRRQFGQTNTWPQEVLRLYKDTSMKASDKKSMQYLCLARAH